MTFGRHAFQIIIPICIALVLSACSPEDYNYEPPEGSTGKAITHFSYDKLVYGGEDHSYDMMILPNGDSSDWGFDRSNHVVAASDIQDQITAEVKMVIIGTGLHGEGALDEGAKTLLKGLEAKGVSSHVLATIDAAKLFNASSKEGLLTFIHVRN